MRPLKLRTRLTILILTIAIPIFSAVIVFVSARAGTLLERNALEELHGTNQSLGSSVSRWLDSYTVLLRQLAALPDIISMEPERHKPILLVTASADPKLFLVQTVGLNGINVARNDDSALRDYSDRQWYLGARAGNPITTEALISRTTGNPALNLSMPIRDANGSIVGVISIVSELDDVAASVHASKVGETGYAYVVDEIGRVIAHPDPTFSNGLYDLSSSPPVVFLQAGSQGAMSFTDEKGVRWVANVSRLDNGWGIVVQQQEAELLGPLRYFQFTSWAFSLAGILLLLVFAAWAIRRALNPIEALTNTALAISGGDLERVVRVENRDEVGTLAVAFNDMTARMRDLILSLERRIDQLDQTKVALNASLLRQTAILDNIPDLAWLKDEKSRFIAVNEPFGQACGFIPAELVGKTDLDIWPEELAQGYRKDDYEVMQSGKRKHVEERLMDSVGQERWIETVKTPIFDSRGELIGTAGIARDITERKRMEAALQKSELRYRAIVESTTDLICRFLPDTTLTFVNEAYCRYFGQTRDQLVGTRFLALIPETDWAGVQGHVASVMRDRKPVTYSHEVITPQGDIRWQQWTDSTILNEDGDVVELQSVGRDITELKHIEEALKESQRRLSTAMRATKIGVWEWDMRTNKAYWSDENYRVLGLEPGGNEAKYANWAKCVHPDDLPAAEAKVSEAMQNRNELNIEFRVVWPDGSIHWINDIGSILADETGEPLGMYGIQMDVTERKLAEEERERLIGELEAKNSELERFTYTVSHDLKSPVVTIKGFLGFIKQDIAAGNMERFHSDLERIGNAAQKMEQLLRDLLELSRIGRLMNPPKEIPFESLVRETLELVHGQIEACGAVVHVQPDLPVIHGDRPRLIEVLQNLLDNAAKYMGDQPNPRIEIGQRGEENGRLVFYVKDNGMGVAPEHHERIFGLFNKLDAQSEGTGVGLALVKRIIEFHGGRVWVEGDAGKGSTFLFTLPARPSA
jgi:PAS domain S-box-containing protein